VAPPKDSDAKKPAAKAEPKAEKKAEPEAEVDISEVEEPKKVEKSAKAPVVEEKSADALADVLSDWDD